MCGEPADDSTRNLRHPPDSGYTINLCTAHQAVAEEAWKRFVAFAPAAPVAERPTATRTIIDCTACGAPTMGYCTDCKCNADIARDVVRARAATPAPVVDLVEVLERRAKVAELVADLREGGVECCVADELRSPELGQLDDATLEKLPLEELARIRGRLTHPIDRIRFDNRWIRGVPLGLQLLALESGATGAE
jgi:hypothetical protein